MCGIGVFNANSLPSRLPIPVLVPVAALLIFIPIPVDLPNRIPVPSPENSRLYNS